MRRKRVGEIVVVDKDADFVLGSTTITQDRHKRQPLLPPQAVADLADIAEFPSSVSQLSLEKCQPPENVGHFIRKVTMFKGELTYQTGNFLRHLHPQQALADLADIAELTEADIQTLVGPQLGPRKRMVRRHTLFRETKPCQAEPGYSCGGHIHFARESRP